MYTGTTTLLRFITALRRHRHILLAAAAISLVLPHTAPAQLCTDTETWVPVPMPGYDNAGIMAMLAQPDGLYALMGTPRATAVVRWDGTSWATIVPWTPGGFRFPLLAKFNGDLYAGFTFTLNDSARKRGYNTVPTRWDGTAWRNLPKLSNSPTVDLSIGSMVGGDQGLFCSYSKIDSNTWLYYIARWDGTQWTEVYTAPAGSGIELAEENGEVYAVGASWKPSPPNSDSLAAIARWNGTRFEVVVDSIPGYPIRPVLHNGTLYFGLAHPHTSRTDIMRWDGRSLTTLPAHGISYFDHLSLFGDDVYVFGSDASAGTSIVRYDGTAWHPVSTINYNTLTAEYKGHFYGGGYLLSGCVPYPSTFVRLCRPPECGVISGQVYHDADGNCTQSAGDAALAGRMVTIDPAGYNVRTDASGMFHQLVQPGTYTLTLAPRIYWQDGCRGGASIAADITTGGNSSGNDFALTAEPGVRDGVISLTGGRARPRQVLPVTITLENIGTEADSGGTLRLRTQPALSIGEVKLGGITRKEPGLMEATLYLLPGQSSISFNMELIVPPTAQIGSTFRLIADLEVHKERDDRNNHDTLDIPVTTSYDPNEIVVTPAGSAPDGTIQRSDSVLTYTIHFQNTGTDTAFYVMITDTLDPALDAASLEMCGASHHYTLEQHDRGTLTWYFMNIELPDSASNERNSHGYLTYTVRLKRELPAGTRIPNRGAIFFDINPPVITNTVLNTIAQPSAVDAGGMRTSFAIAPNPARDRATVHIGEGGGTVELRTLTGRTVQHAWTQQPELVLDLAGLPAGVYLVSARQRNGEHREGSLIVVR